jgi:hypothetical protein
MKDLERGHRGIDVMPFDSGIVVKHRLGFVVVGAETVPNNLLVGIIETVVPEGPLLETGHQFVPVGTGKMKDAANLDMGLHEDGLGNIPRDSIQNEKVAVRVKLAGFDCLENRFMPETHGHLVRNQLTLAGVFKELCAKLTGRIQRPENITAGTMIKTGNLPQDLALGSLAASRCAENQNSAIT